MPHTREGDLYAVQHDMRIEQNDSCDQETLGRVHWMFWLVATCVKNSTLIVRVKGWTESGRVSATLKDNNVDLQIT
jgi:hypothetical protein